MKLFQRLAMYITSQHPEWVPPDLRDLLESAPDAMVIVNADGRIVVVNSQTEILSATLGKNCWAGRWRC